MIDIENNLSQFLVQLEPIRRKGINELVDFLVNKSDFKTAPASTKFHLNVEGGLVQHSLNVLRFGKEINRLLQLNLAEESITITTLLHDLCKVNFYVKGEEWDKEYKDKTNQWRKKAVWKVDDQLPIGHGEKSVILIVRYIELTPEEIVSIRWHMLGQDAGVHFSYPSGLPYRTSMEKYPLLKLLAIADQMAELYESTHEKVF